MRALSLSLAGLLAALYTSGAVYLYTQERWARSASEAASAPLTHLRHPEAVLGVAREALAADDFSARPLPYVHRSLEELPSFYQPAFLLAAYHANRFEQPTRTRQAFAAALRRYPANGRLHLAYAQWLLSRASAGTGSREDSDRHLEAALRLEPDLAEEALATLRREIPPARWIELMPETPAAQRQLARTLLREGHLTEAETVLGKMLPTLTDESFLQEAAAWALQQNHTRLALELAQRWEQVESAKTGPSVSYQAGLFLAKTYQAMGDDEAADRAFRETKERVEKTGGPSSLAALDVMCVMGYEYLGRGQAALAQSLFTEAALLSPAHVPALLGLARTYVRSGRIALAVEQYQRLLQLDPQNAEAEGELRQLLVERWSEAQAR